MEFLTLKPKSFGLDFSDLSLKIAQLKRRGRFLDLASWAEFEIEKGIIEDGEIKNEKALIQAIKISLTKIKGERIRTKNVIASLPEKKAFLQVIQMPKMSKEELNSAVPFEAENYIPLPMEEVYLDFQLIPSSKGYLKDHFDVLIAGLPKKTVDPYVFCLKEAGLFPLALEVESQSISRALIKNEISPRPVLIIDFGKSRASFIIFSGYSLRFTSSMPISSWKLTEAISRALNVDLIEAENLKIKYGLNSGQSRSQKEKNLRKKIIEAMTPVMNNLVEEIKRYLNYYHTHAKERHLLSDGQRIERIILCGRGANLKGLPGFLCLELNLPVELANPWINILPPDFKKIPELPFSDSLGYTSALGLALRCLKACDIKEELL